MHASNIAAHMNTGAKLSSDIRKIERFFQNYMLDYELVAFLIAFCLPKGKLNLSMDRTEWQFGSKWHNLLVITVNSGKVGIPIWVEVLDKSRGVSNTKERKKILKKVINLLGLKRIYTFYADREFIGQEWIDYLLKKKIRFFIRLRNNQFIRWKRQKYQISTLIDDHQQSRYLDNIGIYNTFLSIAIRKTKDGKDIIAVLTNTKAKGAFKQYRKRWTIEVLFQSFKKRGFDIESSHLKAPERLRKLFMLCALAFVVCYALGYYKHANIKPIRINNHGYFAHSIFRTGLDFFRETIKLNRCVNQIFNELLVEALARIKIFFQFSDFVGS